MAPDAIITVAGGVAAPDGRPAHGRPVRLGTGVSESDGAFAVLTVGMSCTSGACSGKVRTATTDAAGSYAFTLQGSDTQSSFGEALSVLVSAFGDVASDEVSGPLTSVRFRVQTERVTLPMLALIDPGLTLESHQGAVLARWSTSRSGPYELSFDDGAEVPVWLAAGTESTASVDARLLEDTSGRAVLSGTFEEVIEGSTAIMRWRSPGKPYAAAAGPPPSRGRPCQLVASSGTTQDHQNCKLTDGDLVAMAPSEQICSGPPDEAACTPPAAVIVDLGEQVPAELVVVRGCEGGCAVDVSADGSTFTPAGSASDGFGTVELSGGPVRSVRVGLGTGAGLREVSVWGPGPQRALTPLNDRERAALTEPYGGDGPSDESPSTLLVVAAVVLAAAALLGVGAAAGRRWGRGG
ncbi:MAG: hypothetical protein ACT452_02395 [Microthrixaceae bacterium]